MIRFANQLAKTPVDSFELVVSFIIGLCAILVFTAILINFIEARGEAETRFQKKSIVETGTMVLAFLILYLLLEQKIGAFKVNLPLVRYCSSLMGLIIIITGCVFNIKGRLDLGKNWANQIRVYHDHIFVKSGVYRIVRHPLYASLIWMFYGAALVYRNVVAVLFNSLFFIPFMYYRAKQEERVLATCFEGYSDYKTCTGMFFPKLFRRRNDGRKNGGDN